MSWRLPVGYGRQVPSTRTPPSPTTYFASSFSTTNKNISDKNERMKFRPGTSTAMNSRPGNGPIIVKAVNDDEFHEADFEESSPESLHTSYQVIRKTFATSQASKETSLTDDNSGDDKTIPKDLETWEDEYVLQNYKAQRRVDEIINRCYYLASKNGFGTDLQSLKQLLKEDEEDEKEVEKELQEEQYEIAKQQAERKYFSSTARSNSSASARSHYNYNNSNVSNIEIEKLALPSINFHNPNARTACLRRNNNNKIGIKNGLKQNSTQNYYDSVAAELRNEQRKLKLPDLIGEDGKSSIINIFNIILSR